MIDFFYTLLLFFRIWNDKGPYRENFRDVSSQDIWVDNSCKVTYKQVYNIPKMPYLLNNNLYWALWFSKTIHTSFVWFNNAVKNAVRRKNSIISCHRWWFWVSESTSPNKQWMRCISLHPGDNLSTSCCYLANIH